MSQTLRAGEPGDIHDGRVYVEIRQGGVYGDGSPRYPVSQWREAIPAGTHVMLFLHPFDYAKMNGLPTENGGRGLAQGARLLSDVAQGMIFEYDGKIVGDDHQGGNSVEVWGASSIDDIAAQVERYLASLR